MRISTLPSHFSSLIILLHFADGIQRDIPFIIMTSDDTHSRTLELLELNSYFGMKPTQVHLLKQVFMITAEGLVKNLLKRKIF